MPRLRYTGPTSVDGLAWIANWPFIPGLHLHSAVGSGGSTAGRTLLVTIFLLSGRYPPLQVRSRRARRRQHSSPISSRASTSVASPAWTARASIGLNFDNSVPGFSAPVSTPIGAPASQASIIYAHETSYYAGGGVTYRFH